jgi:hypothetical protein
VGPTPPVSQRAYWNQVLGITEQLTAAEIQARKNVGVARAQQALPRYEIGGCCEAAMERLLRRCREHGIDAILVAAPVGSEHRALYSPEVESAFAAWIERARGRYQCRFWDARAAVPDALFFDNHHCKPAGAAVFSRRLAERVE